MRGDARVHLVIQAVADAEAAECHRLRVVGIRVDVLARRVLPIEVLGVELAQSVDGRLAGAFVERELRVDGAVRSDRSCYHRLAGAALRVHHHVPAFGDTRDRDVLRHVTRVLRLAIRRDTRRYIEVLHHLGELIAGELRHERRRVVGVVVAPIGQAGVFVLGSVVSAA